MFGLVPLSDVSVMSCISLPEVISPLLLLAWGGYTPDLTRMVRSSNNKLRLPLSSISLGTPRSDWI